MDAGGDPQATDPLDRLDGHPNFLGIIYGQTAEVRATDWTLAALTTMECLPNCKRMHYGLVAGCRLQAVTV